MTAPIPQTDDANALPVIDRAVLARLQAELSGGLFPELLALFLEQGQQRCTTIAQAVSAQDFTVLGHEIHDFKTESATFGAMRLAALTGQVYGLCRQQAWQQAFAAAPAIRDAWLLAAEELKTYV